MRKKGGQVPSRGATAQRSVVVGTEIDVDGFVTVTVTNATGEIRYRVPAEPLRVPEIQALRVAGVA